MEKRALSGKCLFLILIILIVVLFLVLNSFGIFSMNSLLIIVKESEPVRKPLALLFAGCILLAFVIICILVGKKSHKR